MKKILSFFIKIGGQLKSSLIRFPETMTVAYLLATLWIVLNHSDDISPVYYLLLNAILMLAIALPLTATVKLATEAFNRTIKFRIFSDLLILIFIIVGFFLLPERLDEKTTLLITILISLGFLTFILVPYLPNRRFFPIYTMKLITNFFITTLYSLVIYLGGFSITFAMEQLFELTIDYYFYYDIWIAIAGFFSVTYFIGNVPTKDTLFEANNFPKIYRYLFTFIVIPLLGIFTVILYAYFVKILLGGELPKGIIASLVLWYGCISGLILFFTEPLVESSLIAKLFRKIFPFALMIPIGMMFYSLNLRISQYCITPPRYYSLLAGIWILGTILYTLFQSLLKKQIKPQILLIYGMLLLLISSVGPLNAYAVTMLDQNNRFTKLLSSLNMLDENGLIISNSSISYIDETNILEFIHYADDIDCLDKLTPLPSDYCMSNSKMILGFEDSYDYNYNDDYSYYSYYFDFDRSTDFDIQGYDTMTFIQDDEAEDYKVKHTSYSSDIDLATKQLFIYYKNDPLITIDLKEMDSTLRKYQAFEDIPYEAAYTVAENDQVRVKLVLDNYSYSYTNSIDTYENPSYSFLLFIDNK